MPDTSTLLHESSLGIFYPTHHIVAAFPSNEASLGAKNALLWAGSKEEEILALSSSEASTFLQRFREEAGVLGQVMSGISRLAGDDATFIDRDIERAKDGAGFLVIQCESEENAARIREVATPFQPIAMHWYRRGGIESLV